MLYEDNFVVKKKITAENILNILKDKPLKKKHNTKIISPIKRG